MLVIPYFSMRRHICRKYEVQLELSSYHNRKIPVIYNLQQKVIIMKKNKVLVFTSVLYVVFAMGTISSLFIVYKDIDSNFAFMFLIGYLFFTVFLLIYIPFITFLNSRKLKWIEMRKRLFRFVIFFISFSALNYILDYIFRPDNISLFREILIAFAIAFGVAFADVTLLKKDQD